MKASTKKLLKYGGGYVVISTGLAIYRTGVSFSMANLKARLLDPVGTFQRAFLGYASAADQAAVSNVVASADATVDDIIANSY